jgi:hypothetical protein
VEDRDELGQVSPLNGGLFYIRKKDRNFKYHQHANRQLDFISTHANTTGTDLNFYA